ncbi:aspartate kinase [Paraphoma chrysanthemicola]|uniref:Aspartokinase n=1 Tax=Paraphoma chrysanthemicola TaxID=798071 RepID=A0A8K0VWK1_9PLEO|nr:aspartate kinase [Paraphoma chrysanthemicola]
MFLAPKMPHQSPSPSRKPYLVQKYGGTSIGKLLPTITDTIIPTHLATHNLAIVCSARSSTTKDFGTTSLLLQAIKSASSGDARFEEIIETIKQDHLRAVEQVVDQSAGDVLLEVQIQIKKDCARLVSLLHATRVLREVSGRTTDRVLVFGETLACRVVAAALNSKGIAARVVILDDIVEEMYGDDQARRADMFKRHPTAFLSGLTTIMAKRIKACEKGIPIITGFFGAMPGSLLKCVSRGYSDLCAALCAVALSAVELQIWKEVDGIFTADPRKIKSARLLATITSEEAAELTYYGSEVIHPLTIDQLDAAQMPLRLKNVANPQGEGTIIYPGEEHKSGQALNNHSEISNVHIRLNRPGGEIPSFMVANGYYGQTQHRRRPTAITTKDDIIILTVRSHGTSSPQAFFSDVGACLALHDLVVNITSSSQQSLSLAVHDPDACCLEDTIKALEGIGIVYVAKAMSIVSVIGHNMRNMVGVSAEIFSALASAKINIYLISQGASEINISFVVRASEAQLAMQVIHEKVLKISPYEERENAFAKGPWLY